MEKILIVDDDVNICEILEFNLKNEGYDVVCAFSAEEALQKIESEVGLILLDVMMGGISGYKMAEKLRLSNNQTPIIFLTAKDTENDMLTGFSVGGDDYISKPFSIKEVVARVKAVLKRKGAALPVAKDEDKIIIKDLVIDVKIKEVTIQNKRIALTRTEFEILLLLVQNPNKVFSRQRIIDIIWKETPYITERTVDVHITRLRKKLDEYAVAVTNRSGYGYRFDVNNL